MEAIAVANHMIELAESKGQFLDQMKLQRLVYFAHGWHLALADKPLIDEPIIAGPYGPIVQSIYDGCYGFGTQDLRGHRITPSKVRHRIFDHRPWWKRFLYIG